VIATVTVIVREPAIVLGDWKAVDSRSLLIEGVASCDGVSSSDPSQGLGIGHS
jgi:hypothetical protein